MFGVRELNRTKGRSFNALLTSLHTCRELVERTGTFQYMPPLARTRALLKQNNGNTASSLPVALERLLKAKERSHKRPIVILT